MVGPATFAPSSTTTPTPQLEILYQDDFYDVNSGWESYRSAFGMLDYENVKFRMQMPIPKNTYWVAANVDIADVIIEADAVGWRGRGKDRLNQAPLFVGEVHRIFE